MTRIDEMIEGVNPTLPEEANSLAWSEESVIQDNARGRQRASKSHTRHVFDALFAVMFETHGCGYLGNKIG